MKFTLLITALNDAACVQLRKADSNDLNHTHANTHTHTHTHTHAPLRNMGKSAPKMVAEQLKAEE